jgi:cyclophilin family peptidyl-prolyl cis-trans isomerase
VHPLTKKLWTLFRTPRQHTIRRQPARKKRTSLFLESLEDRLSPSVAGFNSTVPAVLSGFVYVDSKGTGLFDTSEARVPGVVIRLTDVSGRQGPIETVTDANGQYIFYQVPAGTYDISRAPVPNFIDGRASIGSLGGSIGTNSVNNIVVGQGQVAINDNFGVLGLSAGVVSARLSLNTSTPTTGNNFLPSAGSGFIAADQTVQPTTPPTFGNSSLSGTVQETTASGTTGVPNALLALTGVDFAGRVMVVTIKSDSSGNYLFGSLQPGVYNLNILDIPNGLGNVQTTSGTAGGDIFQNGQILSIQVPAATNATGYNFTEMPLASPAASVGVAITAGLADDTMGPGGTVNDGITSDASIQGTVTSTSPIVSFRAGFDNTPTANFANILADLNPGGSFFLNPLLLALIFGSTLTGGQHTLHLQATDAAGHTSSDDVSFTLDSAAPQVPTLHMDNVSDPGGTGATTASNVMLQGTTSPDVQVQLTQNSAILGTTTSDGSGNFSFNNITLQAGANNYTVRATDIAGNTSQLQTFFLQDAGPKAVPTTPQTESVTQGGADKFINLSSPTMFTDPGFSNSLIRFNTTAGPLNLELFDALAPQTVANFLSYIQAGAYNNDVFHRLASSPPVLQGGGFTFDPNAHTITSVRQGPTIQDEFTATNPDAIGTIAMAMTSAPNSATSQFFFNLGDDTQTLGASNDGGFAVFGKLVSGADQRVMNTLASATVTDQTNTNGAFNTFPLNNYTGTNFPTDATTSNFDLINSISVLQQTQQLTFTVKSNDNTGAVTATINHGQLQLHGVAAGTANVVVEAKNKAGATADVTFAVTTTAAVIVNAPNPAPSSHEGDTINQTITATDNTGGTLSYSATGLPPGLNISATTGTITGSISAGAPANSPYNVTVKATDGTFSGSANFAWTVAPVVTVTNPGAQTNTVGNNITPLHISASDFNGRTLTFSASNLPSGLSIDATSGIISGMVGGAAPTTLTTIVTATDTANFTGSTTFNWTINP